MSEDVSRQTRSQKRALERDSLSVDVDSKRLKLESVEQDIRSGSEAAVAVQTSGLLSGGEVKIQTSGLLSGGEVKIQTSGLLSGGEVKIQTSGLLSGGEGKIQTSGLLSGGEGKIQTSGLLSGGEGKIQTSGLLSGGEGKIQTSGLLSGGEGKIQTSGLLSGGEGKIQTSGLLSGGEVKATIKLEVQTGDEPVDMSTSKTDMKRESSPSSPDDVIVLSDNEVSSPIVNGGNHCKDLNTELLMRSSPQDREHVIRQLREELRLEEAKLILLKRLKKSQIQKDSNIQKPLVSVVSPPLVRPSASTKAPQVTSGRSSGAVILPPLLRGGQVSKHPQGSPVLMPSLIRGAQPISVTAQQIARLQQTQKNSSSGPPPLLLAPRTSVSNLQGHKILQPGLIRVANIPNGSLLLSTSQSTAANLKSASALSQTSLSNTTDSPASRQAATKLALRKQLEKTLLEIPPPKPPAGEFNFLPSAANNEFIYLLGLEDVVQNLLDSLGRAKQGLYGGLVGAAKEPFICCRCRTDFTCRWRRDEGGAIMCDQCMASNQKKVVKAEHTNRLKAAFVKALQQEQEMEQRILQQTPVSSSSSSSSSSSTHGVKAQTKPRSLSAVLQTHSRSIQPQNRPPPTIKQAQSSRGTQQSVAVIRGGLQTFSPSSQLQHAVAAAALVNRPGVTMAYVNPSLSLHKNSSSSVERHREFLLDMIPSRSMSQTANTWK